MSLCMPQNRATQIGRSAPARASNGGFLHPSCLGYCHNGWKADFLLLRIIRFEIVVRGEERGEIAAVLKPYGQMFSYLGVGPILDRYRSGLKATMLISTDR